MSSGLVRNCCQFSHENTSVFQSFLNLQLQIKNYKSLYYSGHTEEGIEGYHWLIDPGIRGGQCLEPPPQTPRDHCASLRAWQVQFNFCSVLFLTFFLISCFLNTFLNSKYFSALTKTFRKCRENSDIP